MTCKFLKVEAIQLPDGRRFDHIYRTTDGKEHVGLRVIERENPSGGLLELRLNMLEKDKVREQITILTESSFVYYDREIRAKHQKAQSEASGIYCRLCKQHGF